MLFEIMATTGWFTANCRCIRLNRKEIGNRVNYANVLNDELQMAI